MIQKKKRGQEEGRDKKTREEGVKEDENAKKEEVNLKESEENV